MRLCLRLTAGCRHRRSVMQSDLNHRAAGTCACMFRGRLGLSPYTSSKSQASLLGSGAWSAMRLQSFVVGSDEIELSLGAKDGGREYIFVRLPLPHHDLSNP